METRPQQAGTSNNEATEAEGRRRCTHAQLHQQQQQQQQATSGLTASAACSSPPHVLSASSSPSHEFSFAVSLHSSATPAIAAMTTTKASSSPSLSPKSATKSSPALAIDLSPADEIFYHGHLLPLHLLSHLHTSSPRPSTHSLDSVSYPYIDEASTATPTATPTATWADNSAVSGSSGEDDYSISFDKDYDQFRSTRSSTKSKSFSLFGLPRWRKGSESANTKEKSEGTTTENCNKRKLKFEVTQFLKRYMKMVKPLLSPNKGVRRENGNVRRQSYSFSGTVSPRDHNGDVIRGMRRGEYSAPASMRTSPTNSGLLLATAAPAVPSPVSESTMEELQAAIQAAIAHCKNSVSTDQKSQ